MFDFCAICLAKRVCLVNLGDERRRLLEALASPYIDLAPIKDCRLLLCVGCNRELTVILKFQQNVLTGMRNLIALQKWINEETLAMPGVGKKATTPKPEDILYCTENMLCSDPSNIRSLSLDNDKSLDTPVKKKGDQMPAIMVKKNKIPVFDEQQLSIERQSERDTSIDVDITGSCKRLDLSATASYDSDLDNPDTMSGYELVVSTTSLNDHCYTDTTSKSESVPYKWTVASSSIMNGHKYNFRDFDNPDSAPYDRKVANSRVNGHGYAGTDFDNPVSDPNDMELLIPIKSTKARRVITTKNKRVSKNRNKSTDVKNNRRPHTTQVSFALEPLEYKVDDTQSKSESPETAIKKSTHELDSFSTRGLLSKSTHYLDKSKHELVSKSTHYQDQSKHELVSKSTHYQDKSKHELVSKSTHYLDKSKHELVSKSTHYLDKSQHELVSKSTHYQDKSQHELVSKSTHYQDQSKHELVSKSTHYQDKSQHELVSKSKHYQDKSQHELVSKSTHYQDKSQHELVSKSTHNQDKSKHELVSKSTHYQDKSKHELVSKSTHNQGSLSTHDDSSSTVSCLSDYEDAERFPNIAFANAFKHVSLEDEVSVDVNKKLHVVTNPPSEWPCAGERCYLRHSPNYDEYSDRSDADSDEDTREHVDVGAKECCKGTELKNPTKQRLKVTDLSCQECGFDGRSRTQLEKHLATQRHRLKSQWRFQCDICKRKFEDKEGLAEHMERVHKKEATTCPMCSLAFRSTRALRKHAAAHLAGGARALGHARAHDYSAHKHGAHAPDEGGGRKRRRGNDKRSITPSADSSLTNGSVQTSLPPKQKQNETNQNIRKQPQNPGVTRKRKRANARKSFKTRWRRPKHRKTTDEDRTDDRVAELIEYLKTETWVEAAGVLDFFKEKWRPK